MKHCTKNKRKNGYYGALERFIVMNKKNENLRLQYLNLQYGKASFWQIRAL